MTHDTNTNLATIGSADDFLRYYNYRVEHTSGCRLSPARFLYPTQRQNVETSASLYGWKGLEEMVDKAVTNNYLNGRAGKRPIIASFFWLTMPTTVEKVLSGFYDDRYQRMAQFAQQCRDEAQAAQERRLRDLEAGRGGLFIYLRQKKARGEKLTKQEQELLDQQEKQQQATR